MESMTEDPRKECKRMYFEFLLRGEFLNPVSDIYERELGIEGIGPVFILLHQVAQVSHLHNIYIHMRHMGNLTRAALIDRAHYAVRC